MTLNELIELLDDYRMELGGETQVQLMTQPHYPLTSRLRGLCSSGEIDPENDQGDDEGCVLLYLLEGEQLGYGDERAWGVAR